MPLLTISFGLQYMDKTCLTGAALFGIVQDLHLYQIVPTSNGKGESTSLQKYGYVSMIFFWGYLLGVFPGVILSQKLPLGKFVGASIMLWGGVTTCTMAVKSYEGFLVQRFFLGFTEALVSPAFSLITAMWYKREEHPLRFAIWYSSTGLGALIGTLITYGIGHIHGRLAPWQYQYLVLGTVTFCWGIIVLLILPDNPVSAKFLSQELKIVAVERMRTEQIGIENKTLKTYQVKETFTDPKTWIMVLIVFSVNLTNAALAGFGSIITQSFGFSTFQAVLHLGAGGAVIFITLLVAGLITTYKKNTRCYLAIAGCLPVIAGSLMIWKSSWSNIAVPLWGLYFLCWYPISYVMLLALISANTAGHTKKAVTAGLIWAAYCSSNGIAPLAILTQEADRHYPTAFILFIAMTSFATCLVILLRFYLAWLNKRRDRKYGTVDDVAAAATAFQDLTDRENKHFRYTL
ncbi:MFS general substrate transporter [Talaromyces proteolyticus]|uniref:MFS general substrate transporter n=1 Tax=Talaromyces proteolyticus TaxID=1131652 RepID=A0AAD4Q082_9EURO|nr:MFS general substrate transporter [Talaromyces proteolyticus]KAH8697382.1 MFS general substrate transporter [Talaromyces proteolyticus]